MKTYLRLSLFYAILAMLGGVFYREFTKFNTFDGRTALGFVHTHAFILGMIFFLVVLMLEKHFQLSAHKYHKPFLIIYNSGLLIMIIMLLVRGTTQVLDSSLTNAMSAAISGIAGIGHILLGIGIIMFFIILNHQVNKKIEA